MVAITNGDNTGADSIPTSHLKKRNRKKNIKYRTEKI